MIRTLAKHPPRPWLTTLWIVAVFLLQPWAQAATPENKTDRPRSKAKARVEFETDIRPILKAHCFDCHGEGDRLRGGLDLRLRRFMLNGGDSGPALEPGRPDSSRLLQLLESGEMPKRDRKPTPQEIALIRRWIHEGASTLRAEPETIPRGMQITPEEQAHWSFQPIQRPSSPRITGRSRTLIDAFLAQSQRPAGVRFSPDASRLTLIRRVTLDLWGVPPTPAEIEVFLADTRPDAYERLVDRLLDSPKYGERWGRHWLDVAGYADSDGYTNDDAPRPFAYKYRDYVIRSFNADKPFNQFITEQLAGDELAVKSKKDIREAALDPETRDLLVATGFLRMGADGTASGGIDQEAARNQVVADTIKIVSTSLLGLSVGCAQCHDHRYDPIPHTDYYRLRALFEPAYDWKQWLNPAQRLVSLYTEDDRKKAAAVEDEAAGLSRDKEAKQSAYIDEALKKHLEKFDAPLRDPLWNAFKTPADKRTEDQKRLLKDHPSANISPGVLYQYNPKAADELKAMDARIAEIRARKPAEDFLLALNEPPGKPLPVTHRFHRGDPKQPKEPVAPGTLTILHRAPGEPLLNPTPAGPSSGRRLAFSQWLTSTNNPLLPRVLVNRIWMHHFGRGLVATPSDFGLQGEKPSHPELLDWLAATFTAPDSNTPAQPGLGWKLKQLHRLILTSTAYRQSSERLPAMEKRDPENRLYWRKPLLRLDAEALRDSMLAVSGSLNERMFGSPVPVREDVAGQIVVGIDKKQGDNKMPVEVDMGADEFRRSVYVEVRRSKPLAFLNTFDAPVMEVNCEKRQSSTVAPQALMLMNSGFALQQATRFANRLRAEAGSSDDARVHLAWKLAYGRAPSPTEHRMAIDFLARQGATLAATPAPSPDTTKPTESRKPENIAPADIPLRSLCQTLLGSNEFLYID